MSITKTRAKSLSIHEINSLVDLVLDNKIKLFGALSTTLTYDEKSAILESIATTITQEHRNIRNKDDVFKEWSNIWVKNKPSISDKLASARQTGGGPAEAILREIELKIKAIKGIGNFGRNLFGIDLAFGTNSLLSDVEIMVTNPLDLHRV